METEYRKIECCGCGEKTIVHKEQLTPKKLKEDTRCPKCLGNKFRILN